MIPAQGERNEGFVWGLPETGWVYRVGVNKAEQMIVSVLMSLISRSTFRC